MVKLFKEAVIQVSKMAPNMKATTNPIAGHLERKHGQE